MAINTLKETQVPDGIKHTSEGYTITYQGKEILLPAKIVSNIKRKVFKSKLGDTNMVEITIKIEDHNL